MTNLQDKKIDKFNIFKKEDWSSAYQNVEKELTKEPLKISKGNNIKNLNGTLLRNGPGILESCLLYTSPSPRDRTRSRMPSSA